jgi:very-long-chain enoyl-CoA reductase
MFLFHFAKRLLETKFVHVFSNETAPLIPSFRNFIFYWILLGILCPLEILIWRNETF